MMRSRARSMRFKPSSKRSVRSSTRRLPRRLVPSPDPHKAPSAGAEAEDQGEKKDADVVDAEFEMVDEDKKKN